MDDFSDGKRKKNNWLWYLIIFVIVVVLVVVIILIMSDGNKNGIGGSDSKISIIEDIIREDNIIESS